MFGPGTVQFFRDGEPIGPPQEALALTIELPAPTPTIEEKLLHLGDLTMTLSVELCDAVVLLTELSRAAQPRVEYRKGKRIAQWKTERK